MYVGGLCVRDMSQKKDFHGNDESLIRRNRCWLGKRKRIGDRIITVRVLLYTFSTIKKGYSADLCA